MNAQELKKRAFELYEQIIEELCRKASPSTELSKVEKLLNCVREAADALATAARRATDAEAKATNLLIDLRDAHDRLNEVEQDRNAAQKGKTDAEAKLAGAQVYWCLQGPKGFYVHFTDSETESWNDLLACKYGSGWSVVRRDNVISEHKRDGWKAVRVLIIEDRP